jgi:UDP-N-acetylmuramoyl-L-alanyl-D-glutamate--2,6-diaminopimelate ligase
MLKAILEAAGRRPGLVGTVHYEVGVRRVPACRTTPEAPDLQAMLAEMVEAGCDAVVMEVSSHALEQARVHGVPFDVAAFTNLTREHLDYHGTLEKYFAAKAALFRSLRPGPGASTAVINTGDPWGARLAGDLEPGTRRITFGAAPDALVRAEDVEVNREGSTFTLRSPWGDAEARIRPLGHFNVMNALAAAACAGAMGIEPGQMTRALAGLDSIPGRLERVPHSRGFQVYVDYAHTDDALANALRTLREITPGRLIVVFGCGGDRDRPKRALMGRAASRWADLSVLTSDNPRSEEPAVIVEEILEGYEDRGSVETVVDRREAIERALAVARGDDTVLVAGKGHEDTQEFREKTIPFDDREVLRDLLGEEPG